MEDSYYQGFMGELEKQAALPASVLKLLRGGHKWLLPKWTKSMLSSGGALFRGGKYSIKQFHKAMPGMYKWWRKGVGVSPIKAGIKAISHGAKVSPIGAGLTAGIGGLGLGGLGLGFRKLKQRTKTGGIIMNDFEQGFNEELEKIGLKIPKWIGAAGVGVAGGWLGARFLPAFIKRTRKASETSVAAVSKAKKLAGEKWSTLSSLQQAQLMSTYMGTGKGKAEVRRKVLG